MELYTLERNFLRKDVIDKFASLIWTERYYGDSEVELIFPEERDLIQKIPEGTFLSLDESDEVMIIETVDIKDGQVEAKGVSLLKWFNNRFIRTSANHWDQYWYLEGRPGWILWAIIFYMSHPTSPYLNGQIAIGVPNPERFMIPELAVKSYDMSGVDTKVAIPFGPVYDAMREIATTYRIGMQLTLDSTAPASLGFRSYKGLDRTTGQTTNSIVRFSADLESLTDVEEFRSIQNFKTHVYAFIPTSDEELKPLITSAGSASRPENPSPYTGFDLRALLVFASDITTDEVQGSSANLLNVLNERAKDALTNHEFVKTVDGEIVPTNQFKYGVHYNLGDIVEVQGKSGAVQSSRVTEYIRTKSIAGERAYPTVAMLD